MTVDNASQNSNNGNSSLFFSSAAIISHNCRALSTSTRTFFLGKLPVPLKEADVLLLQETGKLANPETLFSPHLSLASFSIDEHNVYASVGVYFNQSRVSLLSSEVILQGRASFHAFKKKNDGTIFAVFNIYGPPASTGEAVQALANLLHDIKMQMQIFKDFHPLSCIYLAGDFNCNTLNENLEKTKILRNFLTDQNLFELTAHLPPTWRGKRGEKTVFSKIDHIFASQVPTYEAINFPNPDSDHQVIAIHPPLTLKGQTKPPPPSNFVSQKC